MFCGTDRALTPLADGILKVLNRPVIGGKDLKCAGEQQCVAKIAWHGMPPELMSRPYIGTRGDPMAILDRVRHRTLTLPESTEVLIVEVPMPIILPASTNAALRPVL